MVMTSQKLPPKNVAAEQALIGLALKDNNLYRDLSTIVEQDHFSEPAHRRLWEVIGVLIQQGSVANPVTCQPNFNGSGIAGAPAEEYMRRLIDSAPTSINARDYANGVKALALRREMISIASVVEEKCYGAPVDFPAETIFSQFEAMMGELRPSVKVSSGYVNFDDVLNSAAQHVSDAYRDQGMLGGLSTGLPNLDDVLGGLVGGDLIILGGRPGMGKTALATNVAYYVARELKRSAEGGGEKGVVAFHSLEMTAEQLGQRVLSEVSGVPFWKLRRKLANADEIERFINAKREIPRLPVHVDATPSINVGGMKMRLRALKKRYGLSLVVIDYLQLMSGSGKHRDNRVAEVTEITTGLKEIAKDLDVPVLALSQLSRDVEKRPDKRPQLSDLRESGSIEQDADIVMFIMREDYYLRREKPREGSEAYSRWEEKLRQIKGIAEVTIAKHRHGPDGVSATLGFDEQTTRFLNEPAEREPPPAGGVLPERGQDGQPKTKGVTIPPKSLIALNTLNSLDLMEGVANDSFPGVPTSVTRVVPYAKWRQKCAEEQLDPSRDDKAVASLMEAIIRPLMEAKLIECVLARHPEPSWVWLTHKGVSAIPKKA